MPGLLYDAVRIRPGERLILPERLGFDTPIE
jgi:hypothetical protein